MYRIFIACNKCLTVTGRAISGLIGSDLVPGYIYQVLHVSSHRVWCKEEDLVVQASTEAVAGSHEWP